MSNNEKSYRRYEPDQMFLLPPSLRDWLPSDHLVYFISDVVDSLDLGEITVFYEKESRGNPPYHLAMMVKVLLYAYCIGVPSSRRIAKRLEEEIAFRVLAANNSPDFRTISDFRKIHLEALKGFFIQVLRLCQKAGLVKLGHVSLDGTKIKANASKHKAMSYGRMKSAEERLSKEIEELLKRAQEVDREEDIGYGFDKAGDELPQELSRRESRLKKIREAKAALEEEARQVAEEKLEVQKERESKGERKRSKKKLLLSCLWRDGDEGQEKCAEAIPKEKAQRNFTDPDSRIMKSADKSFIQAYNCQAVVDAKSQIIVGCDLTNQAVDRTLIKPMVKQVEENCKKLPKGLSADAGYFSEANLTYLSEKGIEAYVPPDKQRHTDSVDPAPRGRIPKSLSLKGRMRRKLRTKKGRLAYAKRKETVEPVFGQQKQARGFRQFLMRGLKKVKTEWSLICTTHNILKLWRWEITFKTQQRSLPGLATAGPG